MWPLNPDGEILVGLKIENRFALPNLEELLKVPGVAMGEGGPEDMAQSLGYPRTDQHALDVQAKLFAAAKAHHVFCLE